MLRQQLRRVVVVPPQPFLDVDMCEVPCEETGSTYNDVRAELSLLQQRQSIEDERLSRLIKGSGKGRAKSPEFEFAARTILATGCSARAARDNILLSAQLFLATL